MNESTYTIMDIYNHPSDICQPGKYKFRYEIQTSETLPIKAARNNPLILMMWHQVGKIELKYREAE